VEMTMSTLATIGAVIAIHAQRVASL
jgi:hypothetical protein